LLKHYLDEIKKQKIGDYATQLRSNLDEYEGKVHGERLEGLKEALDKLLETHPELTEFPKGETERTFPTLIEMNIRRKKINLKNKIKIGDKPPEIERKKAHKYKRPLTEKQWQKIKDEWIKEREAEPERIPAGNLFTDSKRLSSLRKFKKLLDNVKDNIQISRIKRRIDNFIDIENERLSEATPDYTLHGGGASTMAPTSVGLAPVKGQKTKLKAFKRKLVEIRSSLVKDNVLDYAGRLIYNEDIESLVLEIIDNPKNAQIFENVEVGAKIDMTAEPEIIKLHEDIYNYLTKDITFPDKYGKEITESLGKAIMYVYEQKTGVVRAEIQHRPIILQRLQELQNIPRENLLGRLGEERYVSQSRAERHARRQGEPEVEGEPEEGEPKVEKPPKAEVADRRNIIEELLSGKKDPKGKKRKFELGSLREEENEEEGGN
jgi:hypothetical protein